MVFHHNLFLRCLLISTLVTPTRSLIISSKLFSKLHIPRDYHPESPARISSILQHLEQKYEIVEPNNTPGHLDRALAAIKGVHDHAYVDAVKIRSQRGTPYLQPYDLDTYLSTTSYDCSLLAQFMGTPVLWRDSQSQMVMSPGIWSLLVEANMAKVYCM